jgi:hypothetical protein
MVVPPPALLEAALPCTVTTAQPGKGILIDDTELLNDEAETESLNAIAIRDSDY